MCIFIYIYTYTYVYIYIYRVNGDHAMPLLVLWPRAGASAPALVFPLCAQLLWR